MATGKKVLPGFQLTLGYTLFYLFLIVLVPLSALLFKTFSLSWDQFWSAVASPRVLASYRLTFGASLLAASVNVVAGLLVAIPSMFGYNYLVHTLRVLTVELDNFAQTLASKMETEFLPDDE